MRQKITVGSKIMYQFYNNVEKTFYGEIRYAKVIKIDLNSNKPYTVEHRHLGQIDIKEIEIKGIAG